MKALDTNILVRFLAADHPGQAKAVHGLLQGAEDKGETFLVTLPVMLELVWVLSSAYQMPRIAVVHALDQLSLMPMLKIEHRQRIRDWVSLARTDQALGLPDLLIGLSGKDAGGSSTLTFDREACRSSLFELLPFQASP